MEGSHGASLNGKIFILRKDPNEHVHFIDVQTEMTEIWVTTDIQDLEYTLDGIIISTRNTVYDLVDVSMLIPTATKVSEIELLSEDIGPSKMINYGDGYSTTYCTFNRVNYCAFNKPISEDDVRAWLKEKGRVYKSENQVPWYEDYVELKPMNSDGTKWEVKRIRRYTD